METISDIELDRISNIRTTLQLMNKQIKKEEAEFAEKQKQERQALAQKQAEDKAEFDQQLGVKIFNRDKLLLQEEDFLKTVAWIKIGDFVEVLADELGVGKNEIRVSINPHNSVYGQFSTQQRKESIKSRKVYDEELSVEIKTPIEKCYFEMYYYMDFNMPQADGISFVDHCTAETEWDWLDDDGYYTNLQVNPEAINNILLKIPYATLVFESGKETNGAVSVIAKEVTRRKKGKTKIKRFYDRYWNRPFELYKKCVIGALTKSNEKGPVYEKKD